MENQHLPLVTVITPSYNQSRFIRETIESVLFQDYPQIEHIVIDGGSTDGTLAVLHQYSHAGERFRFVSEPDRGQSHAINKGLTMARGEIIGWLNSDDTYHPGAVRKAVEALLLHPEWAMVHGRAYNVDEYHQVINSYPVQPANRDVLFEGCYISQPAAFIRKQVFDVMGGVDETLLHCMDYDLWIRISLQHSIGFIDEYLANSRLHPACKSMTQWVTVGIPEVLKTLQKHYGAVSNPMLIHFIQQHQDKGVYWIVGQCKAFFMFGKTPRLCRLNRYDDLWVPPRFTMSVEADPLFPLDTLLLVGRDAMADLLPGQNRLQLTFYVDGQFSATVEVPAGSFVLEIPIPIAAGKAETEIVVAASRHFVPAEWNLNSDTRQLSFIADEILPLSQEEVQFYRAYLQHDLPIADWLMQNRHPAIRR
ncbi:glycosyltransferase family 2 protein [Brevibacillus sp. B_LB10_24]|uniref:glycosyltransferase family 2 protein n=1 Tax=Brevibacillus sp. B_LB10_24 TaxID=3380645 RepID=UPI0038BD5DB2